MGFLLISLLEISPRAFLEMELMLLFDARLDRTVLGLVPLIYFEGFDEFEFLLMALGLFSLFEFFILFKSIVD